MTSRPTAFRRAGLAAAWVALVSLSASGSQARQAPPAPPSPSAMAPFVVVRFHDGVSNEAIDYVSKVGVATEKDLKVGDDARLAAIEKCGNDRSAYLGPLGRANVDLLDAGYRLTRDGKVKLPACGYFEQNASITPTTAIGVSLLLFRETGFTGPETTERFLVANPAIAKSPDPSMVPAGQSVLLPYRSRVTNILLAAPFVAQADTVTIKLNALFPQTKTKPASMYAAPSGRGMLVPTPATATLQLTSSECSPASGPWPFDPDLLLKDLARASSEAVAVAREVRVAVIDSGFVAPPSGLLTTDLFAAKDGQPSWDLYGIDGVASAEDEVPPWNDATSPEADHGTMVGVLALGGPAFIEADKARLSHVTIRPSRIVRQENGEIIEQYMMNALDEALLARATIINASFEFPRKLSSLPRALTNTTTSFLVVAAAGNLPQNLSAKPRWPASYGGPRGTGYGRVITVGASQSDGSIAPFSARGADYVDILAPGCEVPTLDLAMQPKTDNGTSLSAPLVTFAAALLYQIGLTSPTAVRERLIVSADVRGDLSNDVFASGALNIGKTLDIRSDRVAFTDKSWKRGRVWFDYAHPFSCADPKEQLSNADKVLKVARLAGTDWLLFWRDANDVVKRCRFTMPATHLPFAPEGEAETTIDPALVQEIVVRNLDVTN